MRRIDKGSPPGILARKASDWTAEYLTAVAEKKNPLPRRWAHPEIRSELLNETERHCAYCESTLEVTSSGDVEHIYPRRHRPELVVTWSNLTMACSVCNRSKSDYYDPGSDLIHPYEENPHDHFAYFGPFIHAKSGSIRARITIEVVGLLRLALVERRKQRIDEVERLVFDYQRAPAALRRPILAAISENVRDGEYQATVKAFLHAIGFDLDAELVDKVVLVEREKNDGEA